MVPAGRSVTVEASHNLDDASPFPAAKGKRFAKAGFTEYQVWLFTEDGRCFLEKTVNAQKPEASEPTPAPTPEESAKLEEEAATTLRLAQYYLKNKKADQAREKLQLILSKYPKTEAAKTAAKLLKDMPAK
jgi:hypothetical protein